MVSGTVTIIRDLMKDVVLNGTGEKYTVFDVVYRG